MLRRRSLLTAIPLTALSVAAAMLPTGRSRAAKVSGSAHDFALTSIVGDPLKLSDYAGKPVLVVNTASRCGFTGQYKGLQTLHETYADRGLVLIGVPSDDFNQELSSNQAVAEFCELNYGIAFEMTEIERVKGGNAHPLFRWMAEQGARPRWNFNKFLIDGEGRLVENYGSSVTPRDPRLVRQIEALLPAG